LAALRLEHGAYAVTIRQELEEKAGRNVARGALYTVLERLESKGYLSSRMSDPTPERGGRSRRYYKVTTLGVNALKDSKNAIVGLWRGLESVLGKIT
jgi:DNA-binding PadR family transcriptional regulator